MSQYDEQLPEDLRDIAERLSAARVTLSPLELAVALTLGLVLTSGVGVVFACDSLGGQGPQQPYGNVWQDTDFHHPPLAWYCQYVGKKTWTYSWHTPHGVVTVIFVWDCRFLYYHIYCSQPFGFRWGNGPSDDAKLTSYTGVAPNDSGSGLAVTIAGATYGLPADATPSTG